MVRKCAQLAFLCLHIRKGRWVKILNSNTFHCSCSPKMYLRSSTYTFIIGTLQYNSGCSRFDHWTGFCEPNVRQITKQRRTYRCDIFTTLFYSMSALIFLFSYTFSAYCSTTKKLIPILNFKTSINWIIYLINLSSCLFVSSACEFVPWIIQHPITAPSSFPSTRAPFQSFIKQHISELSKSDAKFSSCSSNAAAKLVWIHRRKTITFAREQFSIFSKTAKKATDLLCARESASLTMPLVPASLFRSVHLLLQPLQQSPRMPISMDGRRSLGGPPIHTRFYFQSDWLTR